MELHQIEAFLAVHAAGGFSNAAVILHLSQPAISRRIALLEETLGVALFERERDGVHLSAAGACFLPHALAVKAATRAALEAVQAHQQPEQVAPRLAMVGTLAGTDLAQRLMAFRRDYPLHRLHLRTARSAEVSQLVLGGEAHLGLRYFPDPNPDLVCLPCREEQMVVVAAPQFEVPDKPQLSAGDLVGLPWITFPLGSSGEPFAESVKLLLQRHGLAGVAWVLIDSLTAQKRLVEAGFGISLVPISSIDEELRLGSLRILPVPELAMTTPVVLVKRKNLVEQAALRALQDYLLAGERR